MKRCRIGYDPIQEKDIYKLQYTAKDLPVRQYFNSADVISGNPGSSVAIGFVYTWMDDSAPREIRELFQRLSNYAYLTGFWKTTNGARYVFANILANPNVNKLVIFVFGQKDNGHLLVNALTNFWQNGVGEDGLINGCRSPNPKFEQVPNHALERLRKQADLVVVRNITDLKRPEQIVKMMFQEPENAASVPDDCELYSAAGLSKLYDDGARFDQPYHLDLFDTAKIVHYSKKELKLPLGNTIYADSLQDALEAISAFVFEKGTRIRDQRGNVTAECRSLSVAIKDPCASVPEGYSSRFLEKYADEFLKGDAAEDFSYTYHDRIFRRWGDQRKRAITLLKSNPNTRRCLISLWDPEKDMESKSPPCLDFIWLVVRQDRLEMHAVYRSHHLATVSEKGSLMPGEGAFVPNMYALSKLHESIAYAVGIEKGHLVLTDLSGHLYICC